MRNAQWKKKERRTPSCKSLSNRYFTTGSKSIHRRTPPRVCWSAEWRLGYLRGDVKQRNMTINHQLVVVVVDVFVCPSLTVKLSFYYIH